MPKPDHPPAMMFYVSDFASDSKVEAMSTESVGAYILLLCKAWREEPPGSLPDDDATLARWARLAADRWTEIRSSVLAPFMLGPDGRWHQKRMRREYDQLMKLRKLKARAGKLGANARWQTHDNRNGKRIAVAIANDGSSSSSSSSTSSSGVPEDKPPYPPSGGGSGFPDIPKSLQTPEFIVAWDEWSAHRREIRHKLTPRAAKQQLADCEQWGVERSVAAIRNSISGSYQKLCEPYGAKGTNVRKRTHVDRGEFAEDLKL